MEQVPLKSEDNRRSDGTFGPGNNANPIGRPKGKTIKEMVREWLEEHPKDMKAFIQHFIKENRELAWQMLEGRPKGDEKLDIGIPQSLAELFKNASDKTTNRRAEGEDKE